MVVIVVVVVATLGTTAGGGGAGEKSMGKYAPSSSSSFNFLRSRPVIRFKIELLGSIKPPEVAQSTALALLLVAILLLFLEQEIDIGAEVG